MPDWTTGRVAANGAMIHYTRTGAGEKPPMLLLHGVTDDGLCWSRVAADLQDRFDVVMADARGHGKSDRLTGVFSVPLLAEDAAEVIRGLGLARPVVFGHSMGAITAAALAADYPDLVAAVILEDPPLRDNPPPAPAELVEAFRQQFAALRSAAPEALPAIGAATNPDWHAFETGPWAASKVEVDPAVFAHFDAFDRYDWRAALGRIRCPGLLITGEPDRAIVPPDIAAEALRLWPQGQLAHIPGAGHCIHRDRYAETMAAIDAFLA